MRYTPLVALLGCATFNRVPPALSANEVEGPVDAVVVQVEASDDTPGLRWVRVSIDGGPPTALALAADGTLQWTPQDLDDGVHTFVFTARDNTLFGNRTEVQVTRELDTTPPRLEIAPSSLRAAQGRVWPLWLTADEPLTAATAHVTLLNHEGDEVTASLPLYPIDGAWRALRGIEIKQEPGTVPLTIEATDRVGLTSTLEADLTLEATAFEEGGYIRLSRRQKRARRNADAIAKMREERNTAYAVVFEEAAWSGPWRIPVDDSAETSPFGKYRTYSDGRKSHHSGLDLDQHRGAPVLAAAPGRVMVAGEQAIFGNVVIVNHGHRVASSYNHLDSIAVQVGDEVQAGDTLGTLGSTGQSTGPHLHWGVEVGVVAVDPKEWLSTGHDISPF